MQTEPLVKGGTPEALGTKDVKGAARNHDFIFAQTIGIHEIDSEKHVVLFYRRAEEEGPNLLQGEREAGKKAGIAVIQPQFTATETFDVAEAIEDAEGVAAFENAHPIVNPLRGGENVKIFADRNNFLRHD
jgi:hypothetical protein